MMKQLIERLRLLEIDHDPEGWPAIKMKDVSVCIDLIEPQEAEIESLKAIIQRPDRAELQAEGKHPAPCAKFCEATAFGIEIRRNDAEITRLSALCDQMGAALESSRDLFTCVETCSRNNFENLAMEQIEVSDIALTAERN